MTVTRGRSTCRTSPSGTGAKPGTSHCRPARAATGAGSTRRARVSSRSASPARSAVAPARSSRIPARPARAGADPSAQALPGPDPGRGPRRQPGSGSPARARRARGGPPGDLYVTTRVAASPVFNGSTTATSRSRCRSRSRGAARRHDRGADPGGTKKIRSRRGPSTGRSSACAARAAEAEGQGRGDIRYRLEIEVPGGAQRGAERGGREAGRGLQRRRPAGAELLREGGGVPDGRASRRADSRHRDRRRARRLHDLGRRRAGRDAPADTADVRGARTDRAEALAEEHPALLPARRRAAAADPADDLRGGAEPGRGGDGAGAGRAGREDARGAGADARRRGAGSGKKRRRR